MLKNPLALSLTHRISPAQNAGNANLLTSGGVGLHELESGFEVTGCMEKIACHFHCLRHLNDGASSQSEE
jgi:hypothetical protein